MYCAQSHNDFVQKILRKRARAQGRLRAGQPRRVPAAIITEPFGGIDVVENTIHEGVDGTAI